MSTQLSRQLMVPARVLEPCPANFWRLAGLRLASIKRLAGDIIFHLSSPTGHVVGSAVASSRGVFKAMLPAGRYIAVGASPSLSDANCGGTSPVVVRAGETVHIQVVCPIP